MKVLIVSGFLGAGKTTFIKELVKRTKKDVAVLENEVAGSNIDAQTLRSASLNVWELTEGCICCNMQADFATSVLAIANSLDPEYLIVEPTGVAMLSQVINNIQKIAYERVVLIEPICIIDALAYRDEKNRYQEFIDDQIKYAGHIILSKSEGLNDKELQDLKKEIDSEVTIVTNYHQEDDAFFFKLLQEDFNEDVVVNEVKNNDFEEMHLNGAVLNEGYLVLFLQQLIAGKYGNVVRAKGQIKASQYLRFDVVGDRYAITGGIDENNECVFIGHNLDRDGIRKALIPGYKPQKSAINVILNKNQIQ